MTSSLNQPKLLDQARRSEKCGITMARGHPANAATRNAFRRMCASRPARPRNTSSHEPMALGHPVFMRLLDNALSAGKQDMPGGGTKNNIAINTTRRTTGRIKFCFIRHVQWLTRTIKTNGSEHSDLTMDDVTQLFSQLSVGRRITYELLPWDCSSS